MNDFLDRRQDKERVEHAQVVADYRELIEKAALNKLSADDDVRLNAAIDRLALNADEVAGDLSIFIRAAALKVTAAVIDQAQADLTAANAQRSEFEALSAAALAETIGRRIALAENQTNAATRYRWAARAAEDLRKLRSEHWQLFGGPNPTEIGRRRQIASCLFSDPPHSDCQLITFESVMHTPSAHRYLAGADLADFLPLPDQTMDDVATMLASAKAVIQDGREARYLLYPREADLIKSNRAVALVLGGERDIGIYLWEKGCWLFNFLSAPEQSPAQLEYMLAELLGDLCKRAIGLVRSDFIEKASKQSKDVKRRLSHERVPIEV